MHSISIIVIMVSICYINVNGQDIQNFCTANSNLCNNGGTCVITSNNDFRCLCRSGFTGIRCDDIESGSFAIVRKSAKNSFEKLNNACPINPCYNGGTCSIVLDSAFKCACPPNFKGMFCEAVNDINQCAFEICENGGSCVPNSSEGVKCICTAEWTGPLCDYSTGNF
ncbi:unnamed protein product [Adineta steineri]|uniref:EGF-like domain-containing protein n=1 Tax=Adineta steineri TaxID=433720 RepID=A0A815CHM1_9BILA|nr:unnamed protein product [Adineta steineri]CAF1376035.1 unnamed protein product [Adineta steineri]